MEKNIILYQLVIFNFQGTITTFTSKNIQELCKYVIDNYHENNEYKISPIDFKETILDAYNETER